MLRSLARAKNVSVPRKMKAETLPKPAYFSLNKERMFNPALGLKQEPSEPSVPRDTKAGTPSPYAHPLQPSVPRKKADAAKPTYFSLNKQRFFNPLFAQKQKAKEVEVLELAAFQKWSSVDENAMNFGYTEGPR